MRSGGAGTCRSCGKRMAMPNPGQPHAAAALSTRMFAGFKSLWIRPRACACPTDSCQRDGETQKGIDGQGRADHAVERPATGIFQHQQHPPILIPHLQRRHGPFRGELGAQGLFMLQPLKDGSRRMLLNRRHHQNPPRLSRKPAAYQPHPTRLPQLLNRAQGRTTRRGYKLLFHS